MGQQRVLFDQKAFVFLSRVVQQSSRPQTPKLGSTWFTGVYSQVWRLWLLLVETGSLSFVVNIVFLSVYCDLLLKEPRSLLGWGWGVICRRGVSVWLLPVATTYFSILQEISGPLTVNIQLKWFNQVRMMSFQTPTGFHTLQTSLWKRVYAVSFRMDLAEHINKP